MSDPFPIPPHCPHFRRCNTWDTFWLPRGLGQWLFIDAVVGGEEHGVGLLMERIAAPWSSLDMIRCVAYAYWMNAPYDPLWTGRDWRLHCMDQAMACWNYKPPAEALKK